MNKNDYVHLLKEACGGKCNAEYNPCAYRQAADSLAALKPVAWKSKNRGLYTVEPPASLMPIPLYALDEVKHESD